MKQTVTFSKFVDEFRTMRHENFSSSGLSALFDYLTEYEESTGEEIELDVIAICCEFTEYEDKKDLEETFEKSLEEITEETLVLELDNGGYILQDF